MLRRLPFADAIGGPSDVVAATDQIIFVRDGWIQVWSNGETYRIGPGPGLTDPAWSTSGKRFVAVSQGTNHSDLVDFAPTSPTARQLTHDRSDQAVQSSIWARKPAWSPEGRSIAFVSDRDKHDMSLWQINPDTAKLEPLVLMKPFSGGLDWPAWSPTGAVIAFTSYETGVAQIHALDVTRQSNRAVTDEPDGAFDPTWSPNGKWLTFVARSGESSHLVVVRGNIPKHLAIEGPIRAPVWSPRANALAYVRQTGSRFGIEAVKVQLDSDVTVSEPSRLPGTEGVDPTAGVVWIA
jgi:TolB protein